MRHLTPGQDLCAIVSVAALSTAVGGSLGPGNAVNKACNWESSDRRFGVTMDLRPAVVYPTLAQALPGAEPAPSIVGASAAVWTKNVVAGENHIALFAQLDAATLSVSVTTPTAGVAEAVAAADVATTAPGN